MLSCFFDADEENVGATSVSVGGFVPTAMRFIMSNNEDYPSEDCCKNCGRQVMVQRDDDKARCRKTAPKGIRKRNSSLAGCITKG